MGPDFLLTETTVTFDLLSNEGDRQNVTISIEDDDILEGTHSFNISIVSASPSPNVIVGFPSTAVVIIGDNNGELKTSSESVSILN